MGMNSLWCEGDKVFNTVFDGLEACKKAFGPSEIEGTRLLGHFQWAQR